jgi:hypothetical protein
LAQQDNSRPDASETSEQRGRYDAAQQDFHKESDRINAAYNTFDYTREQFRQIEAEFLALVDELRRTDVEQFRNLSHLEGLRLRLLTAIDGPYRHSINELADSLLAAIGLDPSAD